MVCPTPPSELLFNSIVLGLFAEGKMPGGSVIDAGANSGEWACMYAEAQPSRLVHAIDPLEVNIKSISRKFQPLLPNLRPRVGGLGDKVATIVPPKQGEVARVGSAALGIRRIGTVWRDEAPAPAAAFMMLRLDDLFANETLGFAHLDVEGGELAALRGGARVIRRDRPVLTVELHVHYAPAFTHELLNFLESLQYTVLLVEEVCGVRYDCRNLLALPKSSGAHFHTSQVLRVASTSERLFVVDSSNIMTHAYPSACTRGSPCCRSTNSRYCCKHRCVSAWLKNEMKHWDASNSSSRDPRLFTRLEWLSAKTSLKHLFGSNGP